MDREVTVFWFRRDLRLDDNRGLHEALNSGNPVLPLFIFDTNILQELPGDDARVTFLYDRLQSLRKELQETHGSSLALYCGTPEKAFEDLLSDWTVTAVYTNHDYEPYALERDQAVRKLLEGKGIPLQTFKDQVIFEMDEVVKEDGAPYVVYTPYMRKWKAAFDPDELEIYPASIKSDAFVAHSRLPNLSLEEIGFRRSDIVVPPYDVTPDLVENYAETRDYPAMEGTSRLGPHLRFGTVSIRKMLKRALLAKDETFWNELIWREFFMQILWHYPRTVKEAFKKPYDRVRWRNNEAEFEKWKAGKTGFALVDAGMRQLNRTGYMHNRVRMLVASFLCKHLLIDWRWGEAYFAEKLLDYELASNVGNWQWAAGSGVDAAPYFRIFNPMTQVSKFDPQKEYIRHWVPEYGTSEYPEKMVDHKEARERCLRTYRAALD